MRTLVLGYGNPGRQDDGLGPALANRIDALGRPGLTTLDAYQLNIEDALDVAEHDVVWFVDATKVGPSPFSVRELCGAESHEFTSHLVRPEAVLALARDGWGRTPKAFLLAIRGYRFAFVERLTRSATRNLRAAEAMLVASLAGGAAPGATP
jgi:hydrogenase maturation protease